MGQKVKTKTWQCPKCGYSRTERLAQEVFHNCKVAKKLTTLKEIQGDEEDQ